MYKPNIIVDDSLTYVGGPWKCAISGVNEVVIWAPKGGKCSLKWSGENANHTLKIVLDRMEDINV